VGRVNADNIFQQGVTYNIGRKLTNDVDDKPQRCDISILELRVKCIFRKTSDAGPRTNRKRHPTRTNLE
jgi:hypothetical protein